MFIKHNLPSPSVSNMRDLLMQNIFVIPSYQRSYSWGDYEALDLLNDIIRVAQGKEKLHFFGNIITLPNSSNYNAPLSIIDGQQRLTTSIVILAILRNLADSLKDSTTTTNQRYMLHDVCRDANIMIYGGSENEQRPTANITLQMRNLYGPNQHLYREYFNHLVLDFHNASNYYSDYTPIRSLHNIYRYLYSRLVYLLKNKIDITSQVRFLNKLIDAFQYSFYVIVMKAKNRSEALTIYMTLNTRGKNLSIPDIVKANLAGIAGKHNHSIHKIMKQWDSMSDVFNKNNKYITSFLSVYWKASHESVSNRELPRCILDHVNTVEQSHQMMRDLYILSPVYKELVSPSQSKHLLSELDAHISILNRVGSNAFYSLILSLFYRQYSNSDIDKIFHEIVRIEMREALLSGYHFDYDTLSRNVWNHNLSTDKIVNLLHQRMPERSYIYDSCLGYRSRLTHSGKRASFILYVLAMVYDYYYNDFSNDEIIYNKIFKNHGQYDLINIDTSDQDYMSYLGNFTLIEKGFLNDADIGNINGIVNLLKESHLKGNQVLAKELMSCILNDRSIIPLINKRRRNISNAYIHLW